MRLSAEELDGFYSSRLGEAAAYLIMKRLGDLWGDCKGLNVLGMGYAHPLLSAYAGTARACIAATRFAASSSRRSDETSVSTVSTPKTAKLLKTAATTLQRPHSSLRKKQQTADEVKPERPPRLQIMGQLPSAEPSSPKHDG